MEAELTIRMNTNDVKRLLGDLLSLEPKLDWNKLFWLGEFKNRLKEWSPHDPTLLDEAKSN